MNRSAPSRNAKKILSKAISLLLLLSVASFAIAGLPIITGQSSPGSYFYEFTVSEDGFTKVDLSFQSTESTGSSWVIVPKFSPWNNVTVSGNITESNLYETQNFVGEDYYFYEVLEFHYASESSFEMKIQFNMSEGALIIEPRGIFFSPLIGFHHDSVGKSSAEILFPGIFTVKEEFIASSSGRSTYTTPSSNHVIFDLQDNLERLQIEFETAADEPAWRQLDQSVFSFQTPERYENHASEILNLFTAIYGDFTQFFNVTLEDIGVQFFLPKFETLLSVGGYVPFTGQSLGEININIFFVRAVNGTIEAIALHELLHHFLWRAGLSPDSFLWFHEGLAQSVSIETVDDLGYEGATIERSRLDQSASQYISQYGEDFGFLQDWTPRNQQPNVASYYVASYYVVSELAEAYGGLDFYNQFFELIQGLKIETNDELAFHLSFAANASVDLKLKQWGFDIRLLYIINQSEISPELIFEAEKAVDGLSPVFQPYSLIAKLLHRQALLLLERGDYDGGSQLLEATISLVNLAPFLTLLTLVALLGITAYILLRRKPEPSFDLAPPPDYEETSAQHLL